jgi:hypothetical protein
MAKCMQTVAKLCLNYRETIPKCGEKMGNFFRIASLRPCSGQACVSRIALEEFLDGGYPSDGRREKKIQISVQKQARFYLTNAALLAKRDIAS